MKDRTSNTPSTPSAFGIDPNSSVGIEPRAVELWTSIAGESPVKQNNGYKVWPLNPRQSIEPDLDTFIRKFARGIRGWAERPADDILEEDFTRSAWIGVIFGSGTSKEPPTEIELPASRHQTCQDIINMIAPYKTNKIALVLPTR